MILSALSVGLSLCCDSIIAQSRLLVKGFCDIFS
uniref:Uncharacterized protein n=1 Tax=Siphoviridae sp. ctTDf8 TaxID=2825517 RepID=A0A8S5UJB3_9CAUD|nr:MAG TPA: hypothetical protein [Siphoviridae sp. ctTDf8]